MLQAKLATSDRRILVVEGEHGMVEPQIDSTYVIESTDQEYARLVRLAQLYGEHVADSCRRVGVRAGDRVIDVGCGAIGALPELAREVGPTGGVVGLDFNADALVKAQAILTSQGLSHVQVVQGDINTMAPKSVPGAGAFDLAYCRLFLFHQRDPATTLRRMGELVRPGGTLVAHELVLDPELRPSEPSVAALERWYELLRETMRPAGASPLVASRLGETCAATGLREVSQRAYFVGSGPRNAPVVLDLLIRTLTSYRKAVVDRGLATADEVSEVAAALDAAKGLTFRYFWGILHNELIAQVPD